MSVHDNDLQHAIARIKQPFTVLYCPQPDRPALYQPWVDKQK
ncbi:hypothetical protein ACI2JR_16050 [Klebsiella sp. NPDC088457]